MNDAVKAYVAKFESMKLEGYWGNSVKDTQYPWPVGGDDIWPDRDIFLNKLKIVETNTQQMSFRGYSTCRICNNRNGSREFITDTWRWPEGFSHYIKEHNVIPSKGFVNYINSINN